MTACTADQCDRGVFARGLCQRHYRLLREAGGVDQMRSRESCRPVIVGDVAYVPLTRGQTAIIDAADALRVGRYRWSAAWSETTRSYYASGGGRPGVHLQRFLLDAPAGTDVDHLNHDTLDNRRSNLRLATRVDNNRNRAGVTALNSSGYMGVGWNHDTNSWRARICVQGKRHHVGLFPTAEDAALARDQYIRDHCPSEFWTFNFPLLPGERGLNDAQEATA